MSYLRADYFSTATIENTRTHRERKCAEKFKKTAISILVISNHNSFRMLFDKISSESFIWKMYLYFSIGNDQLGEPALCQLYRHTFVPYTPDVLKNMLSKVLRTCISTGYVTALRNTYVARILLNDTEVCSTAFSRKCEQCHVVSWRRKLNRDLFNTVSQLRSVNWLMNG